MTRVEALPPPPSNASLLQILLSLTENEIVPLLHESGKAGNLPFGAAILSKVDMQPITVAANNSHASPLLHAETNCIRKFFEIPEDVRPDTAHCVLFATHEPCSLCLSGIAWTAFPLVFYLFTHQDTRDRLHVAGDIDILEAVFRVSAPSVNREESLQSRPLYNSLNKFFTAMSLADLLRGVEDGEAKEKAERELERIKSLWDELGQNSAGG